MIDWVPLSAYAPDGGAHAFGDEVREKHKTFVIAAGNDLSHRLELYDHHTS